MRILPLFFLLGGCLYPQQPDQPPDGTPTVTHVATPTAGAGFIDIQPMMVSVTFDTDPAFIAWQSEPARCKATFAPGGPPVGGSLVDAGELTISGESATMTIPDGANGQEAGTVLFPADDALTVTSTGATVPAFEASTRIPEALIVDAPDEATVDRTQDLVLRWAARSSATMTVGISEGRSNIACEVPADAGSATIPATELAKLAAGPAMLGASLSSDLSVDAGSYPVLIRTSTPAILTDGTPYSYPVTLE